MPSIKEHIDTQVIGQDSYSARGTVGGATVVFGGQVLSQALTSAVKSISDLDSDFLLHSVHGYFVSPTLYDRDIFYKVQRVKEGKSFCSLTVDASQASDKTTFKCMISFNKPEPNGSGLYLTTRKMPVVPHPERSDVPDDYERRHFFDYKRYSPVVLPGLDVRLCFSTKELEDLKARRPTEAKLFMWIKENSGYSDGDHQNYHRCAIATASDILVARCVTKPFPHIPLSKLHLTSLDHSIWFHADCNSQDWHLYVVECEHSQGGQALNSLWVYKEDGTLVATGKQESLCRPKL